MEPAQNWIFLQARSQACRRPLEGHDAPEHQGRPRRSTRRHSHLQLRFTVTDYDAISIYFPTFDTVAPLVNLDLRYDPIQKVVGGRKQLDMCLYDGLGSQSEYLDVTVRDSGPRPPAGSDFSLWHRDGGSDASQRLDYRVHLDYGGHRLAMKHNVKQQLRGIDSAQLRLVMLPGISQPVYCVPTPLTLEHRLPLSPASAPACTRAS